MLPDKAKQPQLAMFIVLSCAQFAGTQQLTVTLTTLYLCQTCLTVLLLWTLFRCIIHSAVNTRAHNHCGAGYAYPESAVKFFLQQAEQSGASVMYEHPVKSLEAAKAGSHVTGTPEAKVCSSVWHTCSSDYTHQ